MVYSHQFNPTSHTDSITINLHLSKKGLYITHAKDRNTRVLYIQEHLLFKVRDGTHYAWNKTKFTKNTEIHHFFQMVQSITRSSRNTFWHRTESVIDLIFCNAQKNAQMLNFSIRPPRVTIRFELGRIPVGFGHCSTGLCVF